MGKKMITLPHPSLFESTDGPSALLIIPSAYEPMIETYFSMVSERDFDILEEPLGKRKKCRILLHNLQ